MSNALDTTQVLFIDSRVANLQELIDGAKPGEAAFVLDPGSDGVQQIADILAADKLTNLSSISIVCFGASSGEIDLGSTVFDDSELSSHSSALTQIRATLAPSGSLQLYSSDASGATGPQFVADLSHDSGNVGGASPFMPTLGHTAPTESFSLNTPDPSVITATSTDHATATAQSHTVALDSVLTALYQAGSVSPSLSAGTDSALNTAAPAFPTLALPTGPYVTIDATAIDGDGAAALLELQSIGLVSGASFGGAASGLLPIANIGQLLSLHDVLSVSASSSSVNSNLPPQGSLALKADIARTNFGVDGTGIKIGILSDSFNTSGNADTMATDIANDYLPANTTILNDFAGGTDEGRGMAQIVHTIAPNASIMFDTAEGGQAVFAQHILDLAAAGATVIVDDISYFAEFDYQDGPIAQAIAQVEAQGVAYFSSAANNDSTGYEGAFVAGTTFSTTRGNETAMKFSNTGNALTDSLLPVNFIRAGNQSISFVLQWSNPGASASPGVGATADLDLFLVNASGAVVSGLQSVANNINGDPVEELDIATNGFIGQLFLRVGLESGPAPADIRILAVGNSTGKITFGTEASNTNSGTLFGHNGVPGGSVGAVNVTQTPAFGTATPVNETFSSSGPDQILFDTNGNPLTTPVIHNVTFSGVDGIDTSFFPPGGDSDGDGFPNFFGTSAAAPSLAAVAVLMQQARATLTPTDISNLLRDGSIPFGNANVAGSGLVQASEAVGFAQTLNITNTNTGQTNLFGTHLADTITGGSAADTIEGFGGNDIINGAGGNNTAVFTGTLADYSIVHNGNNTVTVTDNRALSPDGADTLSNISALKFSDQTVVELLTDLNGAVAGTDTTASFTEQTALQIAPSAIIANHEAVNLTSLTATLVARPDGNAVESLTLNNAALLVAANDGLTVTYTPATGVLSVTGSASTADYQSILDGIVYNDTSDTPNATARTVTVTASDGFVSTATATISVAPVNDAPSAITPASYNATEQTTLTLKGTGMSVSDVDGASGTETITLSVGEGTLHAVVGDSGVTINGGDNTASIQISGTLAQLNALLSSSGTSNLTYIDNLDNPAANNTLTLSINDNGNTGSGGAKTGSATSTINVAPVNDAPVAAITPASYSTAEQTTLTLKGAGLSVSDVDGASGTETIILSVGEGTLNAQAGNSGITINSGNNSASVQISGTLAQLNAFLGSGGTSNLTYIDNLDNPATSTTLTLSVNDNGNTGSGGAKAGSANATINIAPVNDFGVVITPASYSATEQTALTLKGTGMSVSDVDAQGGVETITLAVGEGLLHAVAGNSGVTIDSGDNTSSLQISGTLAQINALLSSGGTSNLTYIDNLDNPAASTTLTLSLNDNGHTGSGGAKIANDTSAINITAIDDAPVNHLGGPFQAQSGTNLALTSLSISDPDAGSGILTTTLSVAHGTLSMASDGGAAVAGSGSASVTLTGTLNQINTTLSASNNVLYHSNTNFSGPDTLTVTTNDNGNTGLGGPLTVTDIVGIDVQSAALPAGDGHFGTGVDSDFLLRNDDGTFRLDQVTGGQDNALILGGVGNEWHFRGAGDFNGDGISDFLIQRDTDNLLGVDEFNANHTVTFAPLGPVGPEWHVAGIGDFNGDHTSDILWQRDDGTYRIYNFNNYHVVATPILGATGSDQHFVGIGDFNGDGTSDVLLRTDGGLLLADEFKNDQVFNQALLAINANNFQVAAIGDFNGDHTSDLLLLRNDGFLFVETVVNSSGVIQPLEPLAPNTHVAGVGDFNHDGATDLLLRQDNGNFEVQTFQNGQVSQPISLGQVGNEWHIV